MVAGHSTPVIATLSGVAETISFDTVKLDLERALGSIDSDPEDAITAACSTIESVCRSILIELRQPLPAKKDVSGLFNAVKQPLALSPDLSDLDPQIAADVRMTLGGLATVIQGVGALRTHAGDAHGRERGYARVDARIARLGSKPNQDIDRGLQIRFIPFNREVGGYEWPTCFGFRTPNGRR
ncbi:abortive infection family protein [Haematospirillum jordaniae]|nr:abortive infection family protein [Haematospirillum jordaniae]